MIRYATIGRGTIVDCFISGAQKSGVMELSAVYSRNYETGAEYAQKWGCDKVYTSLYDLAADKSIDAVYIASPNVCHAEQSEIMLNGGKHVLCEKPITTSASEYKRIKALADSKGLIYMEAIIPIYVESRPKIKAAIESVGKIAMARLDYCQLTSRYERLLKGEQVNIFDMSLHAGTLMDLGVYCVYAAVDFFGKPKSIKATASYLSNGADRSGVAIFEYDNFTASLTYSKVGQSIAPSEITGDKGSVLIDRVVLNSGAYLKCGKTTERLDKETPKDELMMCEARAFAEFVEGNNLGIYQDNSQLCYDVHCCMDEIKRSAEIVYPETHRADSVC